MQAPDWHSEDIKAAVRKRGRTLTDLAREAGFSDGACRKALTVPWPAVERVIADFLGQAPAVIWPSRYDAKGAPRRGLRSKNEITATRRRRHRQK